MPTGDRVAHLGPPGRFCMGLATEQSTGLPVHVDARFFGKISRTDLDFRLPYNDLLLDVAVELLAEVLDELRRSKSREDRRAVTLLLHRSPGELADRVFESGGVADGPIILSWSGESFLARSACRMPDARERGLLELIGTAVRERPDTHRYLPEASLVTDVPEVLESIGLPGCGAPRIRGLNAACRRRVL